ncbi:MAG: hypothetical protein ABSF54_01555 [Bryobacteraceae bacterium]|jgi:hypothetical protein
MKQAVKPLHAVRFRKNGKADESRHALRFPIKLPVRYQAGGECGWGEIVNIGSRGALFTTDRALALHACVEVYVEWPVLLHNSIQLSLIVSGVIVRVEPGRAVLAIEKYRFRTCASAFFHRTLPLPLPGRASSAPQSPTKSHTLLHRRPNAEASDARWERVFQERFADPDYYSFRLFRHTSPFRAI